MAQTKVTKPGIADNAITTAKILDNNVTVAKLPTTLDISSNTVTLPASVSGLGTGIDVTSQITGTVPVANLGSGTASSSTYLAGDQTYKALSEYNDDAIQNDIATLALHQATNANAAKYNLANTNVDVYQDSTGVATFTDCARDTTGEFISSIIAGTPTAFDYAGVDADDRAKLWRLGFSSGNNSTWYTIGDGTNTNHEENCWNGLAETGGGLYLTGYTGVSTGSTSNYYMIFDYTNQIQWGDKLRIGKNNTWGDASQWRVQYSTDNVTYTDIDFTGTSQVSYYDGSGGTYGQFTSGASGGLINVAANSTGNTYASWTLIEGMPQFTARYFKYFNTAMHSSANTNVGFADFIPYTQVDTINATGNYVSTATTANASVSKVGIVITYKNNAGTNTLNTDIVAQVSADGGSNYSTVTLAAAGTFSTGVLQAVANDVSVTPGTSIQYKISFANQASGTKEARITGASLIY